MDVSSLPQYPAFREPSPASRSAAAPSALLRPIRVLIGLGLLAAIAVLLYVFSQPTVAHDRPPAPRRPLDFALVRERCERVMLLEYPKVVDLLGPPSGWSRETEFQRYEQIVAAHPDRYPSPYYSWEKWTDPADSHRWVAVFFSGDIAYHVIKKGF